MSIDFRPALSREYRKEDLCPIDLEQLGSVPVLVHVNHGMNEPALHPVHERCLNGWKAACRAKEWNVTCPTCRAAVIEERAVVNRESSLGGRNIQQIGFTALGSCLGAGLGGFFGGLAGAIASLFIAKVAQALEAFEMAVISDLPHAFRGERLGPYYFLER